MVLRRTRGIGKVAKTLRRKNANHVWEDFGYWRCRKYLEGEKSKWIVIGLEVLVVLQIS